MSGDEARQTARLLAPVRAFSAVSDANVAAALRLLSGEELGKTVAVMICDAGLKYLSTDLWG